MNIIYTFIRVLRQFRRDKRTIALILGAPTIVILLFWLLFGSNLETNVKLGIINNDSKSNVLIEKLQETLKDNENVKLFFLQGNNYKEIMDRDRLDAIIVLDKGFHDKIDDDNIADYKIYYEGTKTGIDKAVKPLVKAGIGNGIKEENVEAFEAMGMSTLTFKEKENYIYCGKDYKMIDLLTPLFITFFVFFMSFLLTGVSFLRERLSGTLQRLVASPLTSVQFVLGYILAFCLVSSVQTIYLIGFSNLVLGIKIGNVLYNFIPSIMTIIIAVTMGVFFSVLARNEFQIIQFIPIVIIPQVLLSGFIWDISSFPIEIRWLCYIFPLTYSNNIMIEAILRGNPITNYLSDIGILSIMIILFLFLSFFVIKKQNT